MPKPKMIPAYIGLLHDGGTEPTREAGYRRVYAGEADIWDIAKVPYTAQIVFPDVTAPGYGLITGYALYNQPDGGDPLYIWMLPEPVDCHAGTIPFIHDGKLLRGVDVSAQIKLRTANEADTTN